MSNLRLKEGFIYKKIDWLWLVLFSETLVLTHLVLRMSVIHQINLSLKRKVVESCQCGEFNGWKISVSATGKRNSARRRKPEVETKKSHKLSSSDSYINIHHIPRWKYLNKNSKYILRTIWRDRQDMIQLYLQLFQSSEYVTGSEPFHSMAFGGKYHFWCISHVVIIVNIVVNKSQLCSTIKI